MVVPFKEWGLTLFLHFGSVRLCIELHCCSANRTATDPSVTGPM